MDKQDRPTVFISFNNKSKDFVDSLYSRLSTEANIMRYEEKVLAWGSFIDFMNTIKEQDFAVLVISDAYLKSYACMYEVLKIMEETNWREKVLFVLMPDAKPYNDDERIGYINFWVEHCNNLESNLKELPKGTANTLFEKLEKCKYIRDSIEKFLSVVADSNCPKIWDAIEEICERIRISKQSKFTYNLDSGDKVSIRLLLVLEYIKENPYVSVSQIADAIGISPASAAYYTKMLAGMGVVSIKTNGRNKTYSAA